MPGTVYRFNAFTVDTRAHTLLRGGVRIPIQDQPFQVLLALLATPGEVITREVLRTRLWGANTFVDFDQSLNSAVRRLRLALDDNSRKPTCIETLPRVGFRLLAAVTQERLDEPPSVDSPGPAVPSRPASLPRAQTSVPALQSS